MFYLEFQPAPLAAGFGHQRLTQVRRGEADALPAGARAATDLEAQSLTDAAWHECDEVKIYPAKEGE